MRNQNEDDFILPMLGVGLRKQILQQRDRSESRNSAQGSRLLVFENPSEQIHFAIFKPDFMLDLALSNDWLIDAADVHA